jgi:hypothetical protein
MLDLFFSKLCAGQQGLSSAPIVSREKLSVIVPAAAVHVLR